METFAKRLKVVYDDASKLDVKDLFKFIDQFCDDEGRGMDVIALTSTPVNEREYNYVVHARGRLRTDINPHYEKINQASYSAGTCQ